MAGFVEYSPKATYISLADGQVVRSFRTQEEDPQAVPRTTKTNNVVYERRYRAFDGIVTGLVIGSSDFGGKYIEKAQWKMTLNVDGETFVMTMPYNSSYAKRLINSLASISDFSKPLRISPWKVESKEKAGKFYQGVTLYTAPYGPDDKVELKYPREAVPEMVKKRVKGEDVWDDEDQMLFFERVVSEEILPRLAASRSDVAYDAIPSAIPAGADRVTDDGELPF